MKNIILTSLALLFLQGQIFAKIEAEDIKKELESSINKVTILLQSSKDKKAQAGKIYAIMDPMFDYSLMARLSLGFRQFKSLSSSQQKTFTKEFEKRLKDSFVDKLKYYSNQTIQLGDIKDVKNRKIVPSTLKHDNKEFSIDYKFYNGKSKGWLIYDVEILGVSVVQTYKNQFAHILENKSFKELISLLKQSQLPDNLK